MEENLWWEDFLNSQETEDGFIITERSGILHDRDCFYADRIRHGNRTDMIRPSVGLRFCRYCQRKAAIRNGITDYGNYKIYEKYFDQNQVSTDLLIRLFVEKGAEATIFADGIHIVCGEDKWKLKWNCKKGRSILKHNNYVRSAAGSRYITKGYHEQRIRRNTVPEAICYIIAYDYEAYHGETN